MNVYQHQMVEELLLYFHQQLQSPELLFKKYSDYVQSPLTILGDYLDINPNAIRFESDELRTVLNLYPQYPVVVNGFSIDDVYLKEIDDQLVIYVEVEHGKYNSI